MGQVRGGMGVGIRVGYADSAGRDLQQIDLVLHDLRVAHGVGDLQPARHQVAGADAPLDGEIPPHRSRMASIDPDAEPAAVLQAPAVLVGALVHGRGDELGDEPAVPRMHHDHVEPGRLRAERGRRKMVDDLVDHVDESSLR